MGLVSEEPKQQKQRELRIVSPSRGCFYTGWLSYSWSYEHVKGQRFRGWLVRECSSLSVCFLVCVCVCVCACVRVRAGVHACVCVNTVVFVCFSAFVAICWKCFPILPSRPPVFIHRFCTVYSCG